MWRRRGTKKTPPPLDADALVPVFIPTLVALLVAAETKKGSPLLEEEVLAIRDAGICMVVRASMVAQVAEERGYDDLDPANVWQEWLAFSESP